MKKIAVFTGTRAEYGLLKPVISKIDRNEELQLFLIVTGTHLEKQFGYTISEIIEDGYSVGCTIPMKLVSDASEDILKSMSIELNKMAEVFCREHFDLLIVLGDRFEILAAVECALITHVPVAHIHGGELTHGVIDDSIRHSVTKMSSIHFVSTEIYRKRIIQMGEIPTSVFNVGALGVENISNVATLSMSELSQKYGIMWNNPNIIVTFHPVTLEKNTAGKQFGELLKVIEQHDEYNYIFTYANADSDGRIINEYIDDYCKYHANTLAFMSMGQRGYLSTIKYAYFVVGNSSSGIIEVPSFGIPTINIGDRQGGRVRAASIIDCNPNAHDIGFAFDMATDKLFRNSCRNVCNPYEKKNTSQNIVNEIERYLSEPNNIEKNFYDVDFEQGGIM